MLCNIQLLNWAHWSGFVWVASPLEKVARLDPDAHCLFNFGTGNVFSWPRLHVRGLNMDSYILPFSHLGDKFKHLSLVSFPWREKGKYSIPTCLQGNFPPNPKIWHFIETASRSQAQYRANFFFFYVFLYLNQIENTLQRNHYLLIRNICKTRFILKCSNLLPQPCSITNITNQSGL